MGGQVQDTPGYGDDLNMMNNIRSMVTFIEAQNKRWLSLELDKQREVRLGCAGQRHILALGAVTCRPGASHTDFQGGAAGSHHCSSSTA